LEGRNGRYQDQSPKTKDNFDFAEQMKDASVLGISLGQSRKIADRKCMQQCQRKDERGDVFNLQGEHGCLVERVPRGGPTIA
jgi:hypothetical protein